MTVNELLHKLDAAELADWEAFFYLEHQEQLREDLDAGARRGVQELRFQKG